MRVPSLRRAVVTGGSSGIGKCIVKKFVRAGFQTASCDINECNDLPGHFFSVDLTKASQIKRFIQDVRETIGSPDILICNAGRGIHEKLVEGNPDSWEEVFKLNVFSTFRLIRAFVPEMVKNGGGDVVLVSSVSSLTTYPYGGIYSATKAAVDKLAETLRLEIQPDVRVSLVRPGIVDTDFFDNMISGTQTPEDIGWGALNPEKIAETVLFVVSQPGDVMLNEIVIRPIAQPL